MASFRLVFSAVFACLDNVIIQASRDTFLQVACSLLTSSFTQKFLAKSEGLQSLCGYWDIYAVVVNEAAKCLVAFVVYNYKFARCSSNVLLNIGKVDCEIRDTG